MEKEKALKSRLAERLSARMDEKGISLTKLREELEKILPDGCTYETVRRYINDSKPPSRATLVAICKVLKLPFEEMDRIMRTDKLFEEYGDLMPDVTQKKAGIEPLERVWGVLTQDQQRAVIALAREMAKQTHAAG